MASVMGICGGLVGPESENVEKPLVFICFLEGQEGHEDPKESLRRSEPGQFLVEKWLQKQAKMLKN